MHAPVELNLELRPHARVDVIDVHHRAGERAACLSAFPKALYCSFHTTAGYLEPGLAATMALKLRRQVLLEPGPEPLTERGFLGCVPQVHRRRC